MTICGICKESVTAIPDSISCYNSVCKAVYHSRCAGLSRSVISKISEIVNLRYYCNECCSAVHFDPKKTAVETLNESPTADAISVQLGSIQETLTNLTDAILKPKTPEWPSVPLSGKSNNKRRRLDGGTEADSNANATFSRPDVFGSADDHESLVVVEPRKLLVASMFHPTTDSNHLTDFLKSKLAMSDDSTELRVHKLVAPGKDISELDYVSFKISVPGIRYDELLSSSIWPRGVRVREFENRPRKLQNNPVFLPPLKTPTIITPAPNGIANVL